MGHYDEQREAHDAKVAAGRDPGVELLRERRAHAATQKAPASRLEERQLAIARHALEGVRDSTDHGDHHYTVTRALADIDELERLYGEPYERGLAEGRAERADEVRRLGESVTQLSAAHSSMFNVLLCLSRDLEIPGLIALLSDESSWRQISQQVGNRLRMAEHALAELERLLTYPRGGLPPAALPAPPELLKIVREGRRCVPPPPAPVDVSRHGGDADEAFAP